MRVKAYALQTRHGFVWKTDCQPDEPLRPALFRTRKAALAYRETLGYFYAQAQVVKVAIKLEVIL